MEPNNFSIINLSQQEIKDIQRFCELNKIEDIPTFLRTCAWKGYEVEKYGLLGKMGGIQEKRVEIEVIREKRVEIPVEVIKEVIKEVPVEKIVTIYDNSSENELLLKIQQLEDEKKIFSTKLTDTEQRLHIFSTKTQENENIFQNRINELENREPERIEIVKEVVIEKTTTDNSKQKALEETIQKIRTELQLKNKEINDLKLTITDMQKQGGSKSVYMDGSNLGKILR
jgi:hypothetical protein